MDYSDYEWIPALFEMSSHSNFTTDGESVSNQVIHAISEQTGVDPLDLDPLNDYVDTDSLDGLFRAAQTKKSGSTRFEFEYAEYVVTVVLDDDLIVHVRDGDEGSRSDYTANNTKHGS